MKRIRSVRKGIVSMSVTKENRRRIVKIQINVKIVITKLMNKIEDVMIVRTKKVVVAVRMEVTETGMVTTAEVMETRMVMTRMTAEVVAAVVAEVAVEAKVAVEVAVAAAVVTIAATRKTVAKVVTKVVTTKAILIKRRVTVAKIRACSASKVHSVIKASWVPSRKPPMASQNRDQKWQRAPSRPAIKWQRTPSSLRNRTSRMALNQSRQRLG